jgi:hypothetical protein
MIALAFTTFDLTCIIGSAVFTGLLLWGISWVEKRNKRKEAEMPYYRYDDSYDRHMERQHGKPYSDEDEDAFLTREMQKECHKMFPDNDEVPEHIHKLQKEQGLPRDAKPKSKKAFADVVSTSEYHNHLNKMQRKVTSHTDRFKKSLPVPQVYMRDGHAGPEDPAYTAMLLGASQAHQECIPTVTENSHDRHHHKVDQMPVVDTHHVSAIQHHYTPSPEPVQVEVPSYHDSHSHSTNSFDSSVSVDVGHHH